MRLNSFPRGLIAVYVNEALATAAYNGDVYVLSKVSITIVTISFSNTDVHIVTRRISDEMCTNSFARDLIALCVRYLCGTQ